MPGAKMDGLMLLEWLGKKRRKKDLIVELWLGVILFYYLGSMIFGFK